jgi:hypothetical protein
MNKSVSYTTLNKSASHNHLLKNNNASFISASFVLSWDYNYLERMDQDEAQISFDEELPIKD